MMHRHARETVPPRLAVNPFEHDATGWQGERLGAFGLSQDECAPLFARGEHGLDWLRQSYHDHSLPALLLPGTTADLAMLAPLAESWRSRFKTILVLGIGGSSLGGATLTQLAPSPAAPPRARPRGVRHARTAP